MEQSKKRDHKIYITDTAIQKVPYIRLPNLSEGDCSILWQEHQSLLRIAKEENDSNEVLTILSLHQKRKSQTKGSEFLVNPSNDPEAVSLFLSAQEGELSYLHNHPSTNKFSLQDIHEFLKYASIGLMSVVTNQGNLYILQKTPKYEFNQAYEIYANFASQAISQKITHNEAVNKFLKNCYEGGVHYEKD